MFLVVAASKFASALVRNPSPRSILKGNLRRQIKYGCFKHVSTTKNNSFCSRLYATSSENSLLPGFDPSDYYLPPGPSIIKPRKNQRIIAIGDVHGDINALESFLRTGNLIHPWSTVSDPKWSGGDTICVQCGDILDRGDEELACLRLIANLSRQAPQSGGAFRMLYGNHEALNAVGLFQYANKGGNAEFESEIGQLIDNHRQDKRWRLQFAGNEPARWAALEPGGLLGKKLYANLDVVLVVGKTVFCHAGLTKKHLQDYGGIEEMNQMARDWISNAQHGENNDAGNYADVEEVISSAQYRAKSQSQTMPPFLSGSNSPVWMRDYSSPNDKTPSNPRAQYMIDEMLQEVGQDVQRIVMGHTPQANINSALRGKAWRIDVGASKGVMGGVTEVLEIIHGDDEDDQLNILSPIGQQISGRERFTMENIF